MLERVLLPIDFSERSVAIARYMIPWAKRFRSEILLVHVVRPDTDTSPPDLGHWVTNRCHQPKEPWLRIYEFLRSEMSGIRVRRAVWEGDPATRIAQGAEAEDCGLIVMATHGAGVIPRLLAGSVTAKVLHHTERPILTAAHLDIRTETPLGPKSPILCAIGLDHAYIKVIQWACELGVCYNAPVFLLHVASSADDEYRISEQKVESLLAALNGSAEVAGVYIEKGDVPAAINSRLALLHAQLLVIGRRSAHHGPLDLRCHALNIVRGACCPVVSIRQAG